MSIITKPQFDRFKDAPWFPKEDTFVLVGGAGGIGSWTSLLLSRAGFKPIVYDFDTLEEGNLAGQLYPKSLINKPKVDALQSIIRDFSDDEILVFNEKVDNLRDKINALSASMNKIKYNCCSNFDEIHKDFLSLKDSFNVNFK